MRRRRIFLLFLCSLVLLATGTYVVLVYTGASRSFVENIVGRFIRRFSLRDAEVDPASGTVRLQGVQIGHPTLEEADVLVADHVELDVNTNPLDGDGIGTVRRVKIEKLHVHLSLTEGEQWDLVEILDLSDLSAGGAGYPAVIITDSKITVQITTNLPAVEFTSVQLELLPQADRGDHMTLTGSMISPSGFEVRVQGTADFDKGEFRALFETTDLPLHPEVARPYSPAAEEYLAESGLTGIARQVGLWIQYPPEPGDDNDVTARLSAEVEGVSWTFREFPYPVAQARGRVTASTKEGGRVHFDLLAGDDAPTIRTLGELTRCISGLPLVDVRIQANQIPINDDIRRAMDRLPAARNAWEAFEPGGGTADVDLFLHNEQQGEAPLVSLDLDVHGASGRFMGFPAPEGSRKVSFPLRIEDARGRVQIRAGKVAIKEVTASREGGTMTINGLVATGDAGVEQVELDIVAKSFAFSDELRGALDTLLEGGSEAYDSYAPRGRADASVQIRKAPGNDLQFAVELSPLGGSASYQLFPYRINELTGNIKIANSGVSFDVSGARENTTAEIGGRFLFEPTTEGMQSELWLHARSAVLEDDLRSALYVVNPDLDRFWQEFLPTGTVDCNLTMWKPAGDRDFQHDLRLDFQQGSALVTKFDRRLTNLRGSAFVHGSGADNRMDISILRGEVTNGDETGSAEVVIEGSLETAVGANKIDLTTIIRGLRLNRMLAKTMDYAEILSTKTWDVLVPSGLVDVAARHRKSYGQEDILHEARVQLRDVRSDAPVLPRSVTGLRGEVFVTGGTGIFDSIRGQIGPAGLTLESGFFEHRGGSSVVEVDVYAEQLPVDSSFSNLMTGPMKKTFEQRNVRGTINVRKLEMDYRFPDEGEDFDLKFNGPIDAKNLSLTLVAPIQELNGSFQFQDGQITPDGGSLRCIADGASFSIAGHTATDFNGIITATPEEIALFDMTLDMHGGAVRALGLEGRALSYDLLTDALMANVGWEDMSLTSFMRATGQNSPITRGTLSGDLSLFLPVHRGVDIEANANLEVSNGRLGEVPMFTAIYAFLAPTNRPQFDGAEFQLKVQNQQVTIEDFVLTSPLIEVRGQGRVGLDGYLDIVLEFPDLFASTGAWLVLPQVLKAITSQVVRFHLYGYLRSPQARPRWLFQTDPDRQDIAPIPPWTRERPNRRF